MYKEKLLDNVYGIDIITHGPEKLYGLQNAYSIHLIVHYIKDEELIRNIVHVLLDIGCKVFHLFGEYHNLWVDEIKAQSNNYAIVVDYFIELHEFEMDLVTHLIEKTELMQHNQVIDMENRIDYLLYDDIGFFWMIQDNIKEYKELENVE